MDKLKAQVADHVIPVDRERFDAEAWQLEPEAVGALMAKMKVKGVPLSEFAKSPPYRGILTGFNEAFLIDADARASIVKSDVKAADVIKPYLRGQDIKRWHPEWVGLWMISLKSSSDHPWPWSDAGEKAEAIFAKTYPGVYAHLLPHKPALVARQDQGRYWWELRSCAYWDQFDKHKIVFPEITWHSQWCIDTIGTLCNNTAYILNSTDPWILCVLNSPAAWCFAWRNAIHGKDEALRYIKDFVHDFPIPKPSKSQKTAATTLTQRLISITRLHQSTRAEMLDWLKAQFEIDKPSTKLQDSINMESDEFLSEVKKHLPKKTGLSSPQVKALREEYARAIEPARMLAAEARGLEIQVHDLVNEAYGLTPEEVALMWDTAPPRMPIPRPPGV
jgi:hypothetical protein